MININWLDSLTRRFMLGEFDRRTDMPDKKMLNDLVKLIRSVDDDTLKAILLALHEAGIFRSFPVLKEIRINLERERHKTEGGWESETDG